MGRVPRWADDVHVSDTPALEVAVIDANPSDRHGTELVLRSWGHHVIGRTGSFEGAFDLIRKQRPHVTVVGSELPDGSGPQLVRRLLAADPGLAVVLVLGRSAMHELEDTMTCGARGVVLRHGPVAELASAIVVVGDGGRYVSPGVGRGPWRDSGH